MEAWSRDVSRWWLLIPVIYFGGFGAATIHDQYNLRNVASSYGKLNEAVVSGFDPSQHSLVDDGIPNVGLNLVRNFGLRVAYRTDPRLPEGYYSTRLADKAVCDRIRGNAVFREASVSARELPNFGKNNVGFSGKTHGLCYVTMPEKPSLAVVMLDREDRKETLFGMPITPAITTIHMPDRRHFEIHGGYASPLTWLPFPYAGCGVNSSIPRLECFAGFWRNKSTAILEDEDWLSGDENAIAKALGLRPVAPEERAAGDRERMLEMISSIEDASGASRP